jgi:hypothetical protein
MSCPEFPDQSKGRIVRSNARNCAQTGKKVAQVSFLMPAGIHSLTRM